MAEEANRFEDELDESVAVDDSADALAAEDSDDLDDTGTFDRSVVARHASATPAPSVEDAAEDAYAAPASGFGLPVLLGIACAALVLGVLVGRFLLGGGSMASAGASNSELAGKLVVSEGELDSVMATYTYGGETYPITAREAILESGSLQASMDADGNYRLPSVDAVLTLARNRILVQEAANRGIVVSDEELATYSEATLGTSDYAYIAQSYGMDEEGVVSLLRESAVMSRLRDEVVDSSAVMTMPEAPVAPESTTETVYNEETGEEDLVEVDANSVATPEYASYIISLAGDEWDAATGTWASLDGPYASVLSVYEITPESATYEAAQTAYYVAYQLYSESMGVASTAWTSFVNDLLSNATISFNTMVA